jgi:putative ABC transport system permease protein
MDLKIALRSLRRSPGYAVSVVLTLALGIAAVGAIYSAIRSVLLQPLPYAPVDRVVMLAERDTAGTLRLASYPTFQDWSTSTDAFESLAFIRGLGTTMRGDQGAVRLLGAFVTDEFFRVLPANAAHGRALTAGDFEAGAPPVAVLTHHLWQRRFGGDRSVVGRSLVLGNRSYQVVGVMPPGYLYPPWADFYSPIGNILAIDPALTQRGLHVDSRIVGRLRPGIDTTMAQRRLSTVAAHLAELYPKENSGWRAVATIPVASEILGDIGPQLRILMVAAALVLLIACVNVANLSLARISNRSRELAIRTALGAGRGALIRLLAAESLVLGVMAGILGLLGAVWLTAQVKSLGRDLLPRVDEIVVNPPAVAVALAACLAAVVLFGMLPALRPLSRSLSGGLKDGAGIGPGLARRRIRSGLVVAQFTLALMLVVGAGLLVRSLLRLQEVKAGFAIDRLLAVPIDPPAPKYDDPARVLGLYRAVAASAAAVPGVRSVALTNHVPLSGASMDSRIEIPGRPAGRDDSDQVLYREVDSSYFGVAGIPIVAGRNFSAAEIEHPSGVVVVNQTLARRYWPDRNPIGQRLTVFKSAQGRPDFGDPVHGTVIGVAGDVRHFSLDTEFVPEVYVPYTVAVWPRMALLVRVGTDPVRVASELRRAVWAVEPDLPLEGPSLHSGVYHLDDSLRATLAYRRLLTGLLAAFAVPACLLAALGIYGVVAYLVTQRQQEIAVRVALGATRQRVLRLVLGQGLRLSLLGVALGTVGALVATRLLRAQLYEVSPTDPVSLILAAIGLTLIGLLGSYLPARRAASVEPQRALRAE